MLRDPERLKRLLLHPERPMQLIIAGKAHPADDGGKKLIQEIVRFADDPEVRHRIVFLPNYDIAMAQPLYPGCDVWLNNPLRPYEACGTSGMKAALNGGLNLSILDGWWDEWYDGNNGWAIPSADGVDDPDRRDDLEADALYDLIENEVAPRFYDVDARRRARPAGSRWSGTRSSRSAPRCWPPGWSATTSASSTPRRPSPAARSTPTTHGAAELAAWKKKVKRRWPRRPRRARREQRRRRRARGRRHARPCAPSSRSATLTPDDVDVQVAARRDRRRRRPGRHRRPSRSTLAETYDGGRHRFDGTVRLEPLRRLRLHRPGHPANDLLASPAELGVVALPV